jgi:SAM-dependent methyltransferase
LDLRTVASRAKSAVRACADAWQEGGAGEVRRVVAEAAYWRFHPRVRRWRAELPRQQAIDEAFDRRWGVDTAGEVPLADVGIAGDDLDRGHGLYRPVWTEVFDEAVRALPVGLERFTFLDYGSGKGKALLLASEFPFEQVLGIEFARPLHEVAERNVRRYASPTRRCADVRSMCADALTYDPPERPLVCFFFNPFDDATTDAVVRRLVDSVRKAPREVFVLYSNMRDVAEHKAAFRARKGLELVEERTRWLLYRVG